MNNGLYRELIWMYILITTAFVMILSSIFILKKVGSPYYSMVMALFTLKDVLVIMIQNPYVILLFAIQFFALAYFSRKKL